MKTLIIPRSLKLVYALTNVSFFIGFFYAMISLVLCILLIIGEIGLPVHFFVGGSIIDTVSLDLLGQNYSIPIQSYRANINVSDLPVGARMIYGVLLLLSSVLVFYALSVFKILVSYIRENDYFNHENIAQLKRIAYVIVGIWGLVIVRTFMGVFISLKMDMENIIYDYDIKLEYLILALIIWVLAHIFQRGAVIQNENELTI